MVCLVYTTTFDDKFVIFFLKSIAVMRETYLSITL